MPWPTTGIHSLPDVESFSNIESENQYSGTTVQPPLENVESLTPLTRGTAAGNMVSVSERLLGYETITDLPMAKSYGQQQDNMSVTVQKRPISVAQVRPRPIV